MEAPNASNDGFKWPPDLSAVPVNDARRADWLFAAFAAANVEDLPEAVNYATLRMDIAADCIRCATIATESDIEPMYANLLHAADNQLREAVAVLHRVMQALPKPESEEE